MIIPKGLEVVWGVVKPKIPISQLKGILVCRFYSVPHSTRKTKLIEHITINFSSLKVKYKDHFFIMGGDINDLKAESLLDIAPSLHLLNTKPTYGEKNIDILISDIAHFYSEAVILPSVPTDIPADQPGGRKPSDHPIVTCCPNQNRLQAPKKEVMMKKT